MGSVIKACATSSSPALTSSLAHAAEAARKCLRAADIEVDEVDVLINVGVYRDNNMVEPAMSAMISHELELGLDYIRHPRQKTAFTFDLMNGGIGMLNAIQVASGYLEAGEGQYVLVVSSDAHPSNRRVAEFPYACVGGALLLERGEARRGFGHVVVSSATSGTPGTVGILQLGRGLPESRGRVCVQREPTYEDRALELAVECAKKLLHEEGVDVARTGVVSSQLSRTFAGTLARRLEAAFGVTVDGLDGAPHTSALAFAYEGRPATGYDQLLFVSVGAGLTAACAMYRP